MPKFEQLAHKKDDEQIIYEEREKFVKENYPKDKSHYQMEELLNRGLDGMDVLEERGKDGGIEAMISYVINQDQEGTPYLSIGIMLTSEEAKGEGVMRNLFSELKDIARGSDCEYISATADTEEGEEFLLNNGFSEEEDEVNGREYLRLDL
jgi:hypothetical protein